MSPYQAPGTLIVSTSDAIRDGVKLFARGPGALRTNILFFTSGRLPRWLADRGIVGILLHTVSNVRRLFDVIDPKSPPQLALLAPSALQALALAVWLIVKGLGQAAIAQLWTHGVSEPWPA